MINTIPALHTSITATVRRDNQPAASNMSSTGQQAAGAETQAFKLNPQATPKVENDNFAYARQNQAAPSTSFLASATKSLQGYAAQAYQMADAFTATAPLRQINLAI